MTTTWRAELCSKTSYEMRWLPLNESEENTGTVSETAKNAKITKETEIMPQYPAMHNVNTYRVQQRIWDKVASWISLKFVSHEFSSVKK